jgi:RHS repeat-associated protein
MCPGIAVAGGGGDGGGGSGGSSKKGKGKKGAGKKKGKKAPKGGKKSAKKGKCGSESEPVDVITGRVFTFDALDVAVAGPLPFAFTRSYSSSMNRRDMGLGFGWAHSLGWEVVLYRDRIEVWDDDGTPIVFDALPVGADVIGEEGWRLMRDSWGFAVDAGDGLWRIFSTSDSKGKRYRLTAIEDRNRNRIAITWDDEKIVEVVDSVGRVIRFSSDKAARMTAISMRMGGAHGPWTDLVRYEYDAAGNLIRVTDAENYASRFAYDERHLLLEHENRTGLVWRYVYDDKERCIEAWGHYPGRVDPSLLEKGLPTHLSDGLTPVKGLHHVKLAYYPEGYTEVATVSNVVRYFGNDLGLVEKEARGGGVVSNVYDDNGHLIQHTDELGAVTSYERDVRGRILRITSPLGHTDTFKRDAAGMIIEYVDPAGAVMTVDRDPNGNPVVVRYPNGAVASYHYNDRGLPIEVGLPNGGRVLSEYDQHYNLVRVVLPNGAEHRWTYDGWGRRLKQTFPNGRETSWAYDLRHDPISVATPAGVTYVEYDGEQRVVRHTAPNGTSLRRAYAGYNVLVEEVDEAGQPYSFRYDYEGTLREIRRPNGEVWSFDYDATGQCIHQRAFDGREYFFGYDVNSKLTSVTDSLGRKTSLVFDVEHNLVERVLADGTSETFDYDVRGDLIGARNDAIAIRYVRDVLGMVVRETTEIDGESQSVDVRYDMAARVVERSTTLGHLEKLERDVAGEVVRMQMQSPLASAHVAFGRAYDGSEILRELAGGGRIETERDVYQRVVRTELSGRRVAPRTDEPDYVGLKKGGVARAYRYDAVGNVVATYGRKGPATYQYDVLGRILEAARDDGTVITRWRHDAVGNRSGAAERYGAGDRLEQRGNVRYEWDADGQLIRKYEVDTLGDVVREWTYEWTAKGQLAAVGLPDGRRVEFRYDAFWRRIEKRVVDANGETMLTVRFLWEGDRLLQETRRTPDGATETRAFVFDDDGYVPLAQTTRDGWAHFVTDQIGAPEILADDRGGVIAELARTPSGQFEPTAVTPLRLQGQYADEETGLSYNRFRYFDPETERYISTDPIGVTGGLDSYALGRNSLGWIDPLGTIGLNTQVGDALEAKRVKQLKKDGWTVLDTKCGSNGIDILAVQKNKKGEITAMRIEECKANSSKLADTKNGKQMSQKWIKRNLARKRRKCKREGCKQGEQDMKDAEAFMNDPANKDKIGKFVIHGEVDSNTMKVTNMTQATVSTQGNAVTQGLPGPVDTAIPGP